MPVISKKSVSSPAGTWMQVIKADSSGVFRSNLPPAIADAMMVTEVEDKTLEGVEEKVHALFKRFATEKRTERKIILYRLSALAGQITNDPEFGESVKSDAWVERRGHGNGVGLSLQAGVYSEVSLPGDARKKRTRIESSLDLLGQGETSYLADLDEIDWSEEAEAFFERTLRSLNALALLAHEKLSPKNLPSLLANGAKLLEHHGQTGQG